MVTYEKIAHAVIPAWNVFVDGFSVGRIRHEKAGFIYRPFRSKHNSAYFATLKELQTSLESA